MEEAHELRFGYSLNRLRMDHWQPELGSGPRGVLIRRRRDGPEWRAQSANQYNGYASLLLGLARPRRHERAVRADDDARVAARIYLRDRWQVSRAHVDVGLRYEYYPLMTRADRGIEQVDLSRRSR